MQPQKLSSTDLLCTRNLLAALTLRGRAKKISANRRYSSWCCLTSKEPHESQPIAHTSTVITKQNDTLRTPKKAVLISSTSGRLSVVVKSRGIELELSRTDNMQNARAKPYYRESTAPVRNTRIHLRQHNAHNSHHIAEH